MMKRLTLLFVMFASVAFGQSDTTQLNTLINANFPNNTSNFITPTRLRTVAKELMRSSANLLEPNTFAERQTFEDAVIGEDSIKSDVGFYVWNGSSYEDVGTSKWDTSGNTLIPLVTFEMFDVSVQDTDTLTSISIVDFNGRKYAGLLTDSASISVSTDGRASVSAKGNAYISSTDTVVVNTPILVVSDTISARVIDKSYGEMGFRDSSRTIALTIDVAAWATNTLKTLWAQSATTMNDVVYAGDSLVVNRSGVYYVSGHISVSGSNNDVLRAYIYKNGSPLCLCSPVISLTTNRIVNLQLNTDIAPLASGDVLKVYIENIGTNNDVAAISGKLTVHRIN
jgi:hypothetical protein